MTFNFVLDAHSQTRPQTTDRRTILITGKKVDLTIDLTTTTTTYTTYIDQLALEARKTGRSVILDILKDLPQKRRFYLLLFLFRRLYLLLLLRRLYLFSKNIFRRLFTFRHENPAKKYFGKHDFWAC